MKLRQHIPSAAIYGPVTEYLTAVFESKNDLHEISFVKRHMESPDFKRLSISRDNGKLYLMAEFTKHYWVIGYLDADLPELPTWSANDKGVEV